MRSLSLSEPLLRPFMIVEDTETPRVARLVARHRERSLPMESREGCLGSATIDTPRPMCSRVTTVTAGLLARGSPPFVAFPRPENLSGTMTKDSPLTVAGAAAVLGNRLSALRSLLIPIWEPSAYPYCATPEQIKLCLPLDA
jgi:hypothetical protein